MAGCVEAGVDSLFADHLIKGEDIGDRQIVGGLLEDLLDGKREAGDIISGMNYEGRARQEVRRALEMSA